MEKISAERAQVLLKKASASIRELHEEKTVLMEKVAVLEKEARQRGLASTMEDKGLLPELSFSEKVAHLDTVDMDVVEEAVKMAAPQASMFGSPADELPSTGGPVSAFESFILTGE